MDTRTTITVISVIVCSLLFVALMFVRGIGTWATNNENRPEKSLTMFDYNQKLREAYRKGELSCTIRLLTNRLALQNISGCERISIEENLEDAKKELAEIPTD